MHTSEILLEKIVNHPRDMGAYLDARIRLLSRLIPEIEKAVETIKELSGDGDYLLRYALGEARGGDRPWLPDAYSVDLNRCYELRDLRDNLESMRKYGVRDFLRYVLGTLEHIRPVNDEAREVLALMPQAEAGFRDYGYAPGTPETEEDEEYRAARGLADAYLVIGSALKQVEDMLAGMKPLLLDLSKRLRFEYRPDDYRPDHDEVETLYHATIYATEIAREGFSAEKPADRRGVGNYGTQNEISFTHDLRIAHDIMRALREMWMIIHGQLTRRHILSWVEAEGIDPKRAASFFVSHREPLDTPEQVIRLYRGYLGLTKLRADPVFANPEALIPALRERDIKDIGIVACKVRLDGTEKYLHGEAEFRVPASRIVGPVRRIA